MTPEEHDGEQAYGTRWRDWRTASAGVYYAHDLLPWYLQYLALKGIEGADRSAPVSVGPVEEEPGIRPAHPGPEAQGARAALCVEGPPAVRPGSDLTGGTEVIFFLAPIRTKKGVKNKGG